VTELLNGNQVILQAAFDYFNHEKKAFVILEECVALARQCQLDVADEMLGIIFAESLMTVVDPMRNKEKMYSLSYSEFVYFLCRITYEHYQDTIYEGEEYYIKLDNLLIFLLEPFDLAPAFGYKIKFTVDEQRLNRLGNLHLDDF